MNLTKAFLSIYHYSSTTKCLFFQTSKYFSFDRTSAMRLKKGLTESFPSGLQTIQFFSKEIAKSDEKHEKAMNLSNDPRDFQVYYFQDDEFEPKVKKKGSSKNKREKKEHKKA